MTKSEEILNPLSCLNKGTNNTLKFVVTEPDITMPEVIRYWAKLRIKYGKNEEGDEQITEALEIANKVEGLLMETRKFK